MTEYDKLRILRKYGLCVRNIDGDEAANQLLTSVVYVWGHIQNMIINN